MQGKTNNDNSHLSGLQIISKYVLPNGSPGGSVVIDTVSLRQRIQSFFPWFNLSSKMIARHLREDLGYEPCDPTGPASLYGPPFFNLATVGAEFAMAEPPAVGDAEGDNLNQYGLIDWHVLKEGTPGRTESMTAEELKARIKYNHCWFDKSPKDISRYLIEGLGYKDPALDRREAFLLVTEGAMFGPCNGKQELPGPILLTHLERAMKRVRADDLYQNDIRWQMENIQKMVNIEGQLKRIIALTRLGSRREKWFRKLKKILRTENKGQGGDA